MSSSLRRAWVICYDIADPRRLAAVHAFLKKEALPTQYSVFVAFLNQRQMQSLVAALELRISPTMDDLRIYPVPSSVEIFLLGERLMPYGVSIYDEQLVRWMGS